jgi:pimeloyl-ACP methyl ester carboxylesterase
MTRNPKTTLASAPFAASGRQRRLLDGPFAETKEMLLGCWPSSAGRYVSVNGLRMYCEIHGRGRPLVLLHAALATIDITFSKVLVALAASRQVIAIEQQAHGRTGDIDRPLSCERMAHDTVALLRQLDIERADFFGFSMGSHVALQIALNEPGLVRKLALVSGGFNMDGIEPAFFPSLDKLDTLPGVAEHRRAFQRVAAADGRWDAAVTRVKEMFGTESGLRPAQLPDIRAPTLIVGGECGVVRPAQLLEMQRLLPDARLEMLSGHDHYPNMVTRSAALLPAFLDSPAPRAA